jgi:probable addiction module antidote protein
MKKKKVYGPQGGTLDEMIIENLKNDESFREEYLKGLLLEQNYSLLARSLRPVVELLGGIGRLAKATGLGRQNLYKALSGNHRPEFSTLVKILNFAGYDFSLTKRKGLSKKKELAQV